MSRAEFDVLDMVGVSKKWTEAPLRALIESIPAARGVLPDVISAHQGLFLTTKKSGEATPEILAIREEQGSLDVRYDDLLAGGYWVLTGLARMAKDETERLKYSSLRDVLYPDGIAGTRFSYLKEGSASTLLEGKLTDEHKAVLATIPLPKGVSNGTSLLSAVEEQIEKGKRIGVLEDNKIAKQQEQDANLVTGPRASEVRRAWLNAARALETVLGLSSVDPAQRELILAPLVRVEEQYDKRGKKPAEVPATTEKTEDKAD